MTNKWFAGVSKSPKYDRAEVFQSSTEPTENTHGDRYLFCFGGYRTRKQAIQVAMYQNYRVVIVL